MYVETLLAKIATKTSYDENEINNARRTIALNRTRIEKKPLPLDWQKKFQNCLDKK